MIRFGALCAAMGVAVWAGGATQVAAGDLAAGEKRYNANCVNCHGKAGQGMASFPAIKGARCGLYL